MRLPRIVLTGQSAKVDGLNWEGTGTLRIGQDPSLDVILQDSSVDRFQAEVVNRGNRWMLRDVSAQPRTPTFINGKPLKGADHLLSLNDLLQFGKIFLRVTTLESETATAAPLPLPPSPAVSNYPSAPPSPVRDEGMSAAANVSSKSALERIKVSGAFLKVQARSTQSWDRAFETMAFNADRGPEPGQAMLTLLRANHHLAHIENLEDLLRSVMTDAITTLEAQRGSIILMNAATGDLELRVSHNIRGPENARNCYSKTLAERCYKSGESLLCRDVNGDQDLKLARSVLSGSMNSVICAVLRSPRKRIGVLQLDRGPFQEAFVESDLHLADAVSASVAVAIESAQLVQEQRDQFIQTVTSLARAVEMRDQYTGDHTRRVTDYAMILAEELKLTPSEKYQIQIGTPLHDIGKIGIDDAILRKPGKLTDGEFESMKLHTVKGAAILETIYNLSPMIPIVRHHHERWDGAGYPDRLSRERIHLNARIVAVADAFDAMTSERPYRIAMSAERAFHEILSKGGSHFDPGCVQAFLRKRGAIENYLKLNK